MNGFRLALCPLPLRVLLTGFLLTTGMGFLVAVVTIHTTLGGLTPAAVATAVRGDVPDDALAEFAEEFGVDVAANPGDPLMFGKSYAEMVQTAHTHMFAMPMLILSLGLVFLGADVGDRLKTWLYGISFVSMIGDLAGLWLIRYVAAGFAYLNAGSGFILCSCAGFMILRSLWDLWRPAGAVARTSAGA